MNPIPFGPFEPDRSKYALLASTAITNCLPIGDGWGPMPSLVLVTEALATKPLGSILIRTKLGGFDIYAGTETNLYKLDTSTTPYQWTDVTRSSGGDYAVPEGDRWCFTLFGSNLVATNLGDDPQYIDVDSGSNFADIPGSPPKAKFCFHAADHLVLGHTENSPNQIYWSGVNNMAEWRLGHRGCGEQTFVDGNEVQGGIGSQNGAVVFQRDQIKTMARTGQAASAFAIDVLNPAIGAISPLSIVNISANNFAWLSEKGFFMGPAAEPIGFEKVDRWFLGGELDLDQLPEVRGMLDPYNKIVWWQYQRVDGTRAMLGFNYFNRRWCYSDQNVAEISAMATTGVSIDGMDDYFDTIDDADEAFDSRLYMGGRPTLNGWDADFKLGIFSGPSLEATLETADVQFYPGHSTPHEMRVVTDAMGYTVKQRTSTHHGGARTLGTAVSPHSRTGMVNFRTSAFLHSFEVTIPAETDWSVITAIAPVRVTSDGAI